MSTLAVFKEKSKNRSPATKYLPGVSPENRELEGPMFFGGTPQRNRRPAGSP